MWNGNLATPGAKLLSLSTLYHNTRGVNNEGLQAQNPPLLELPPSKNLPPCFPYMQALIPFFWARNIPNS